MRGFKPDAFGEVADIAAATLGADFAAQEHDLRERVAALADRHPVYTELRAPAMSS